MRKDILFLGIFGVNCIFILLNFAAFGLTDSVQFALLSSFMLFCLLVKVLSNFPLDTKSGAVGVLMFIAAVGLTLGGAFVLIESTEPMVWPFLLSSFVIFCLACRISWLHH